MSCRSMVSDQKLLPDRTVLVSVLAPALHLLEKFEDRHVVVVERLDDDDHRETPVDQIVG